MNSKQFFSTHARFLITVLVVIIVAGGIVWYFFSSTAPVLGFYTVERGNVVSTINIPGTVSSSNSVDLSFQESGQIAAVYVQNGQSVTAGQLLASLDDSTQETELSQAQAALAVQTANLASLEEGTRPEELAVAEAQVASDQTALDQANQAVVNAIETAYTTSDTAVSNQVNQFMNASQSNTPSLTFTTSNTELQSTFLSEYGSLEEILPIWQGDISMIASSTDLSSVETEAQTNLTDITELLSNANGILTNAVPSGEITQTTIDTWMGNIATMRTDINTVTTALTAAITAQQDAAAVLNKDQKNLLLEQASSTPATIAAQNAEIEQVQAEIANAQLAISDASVVAPFSGIVRDVIAEPGMVVSPDVPVLSIINNQIMKIDAYAPETDIPQMQTDATATVTLDAYGNGVTFPAMLTTVDTAATVINGSPAYDVTLYFTQPDSRILAGMTGNVSVITAEHDNVIEVPSRLVLQDGNNNFVIIQNSNGTVTRQPVTIGLTGDNGIVEIISGLNVGDRISNY